MAHLEPLRQCIVKFFALTLIIFLPILHCFNFLLFFGLRPLYDIVFGILELLKLFLELFPLDDGLFKHFHIIVLVFLVAPFNFV